MKNVKFQFHRGEAKISKLIRFFSRGEYNHVSIRTHRYIYEAHIKQGVIKTPINKWDDSTVVITTKISVSNAGYTNMIKFLNEQVGKKYDIMGILSFFFILLPPRKGYWYCSELASVALEKAKIKDGMLDNRKISPQMFFDILNLVV